MSESADVGLAAEVRRLTRALAEAASTTRDNTARIDLIADLETLKCAAEAAQAVATADLYDATVADHAAQGVPAARRGRGVAQQIGLARRESGRRASMHLGLARTVVGSGADVEGLPGLRSAWRQGVVTEYRVAQMAAKLVHLSAEDRAAVDAELAGTPEKIDQLRRWGDREAIAAADQAAYERDRAGYVRRRRAAEADRHVYGRPAPDTMMRLSALLPVKDGVAVIAALGLAGDPRSRGQVMADTLVGRVTGRDPVTEPVPVTVDVTVPLDALLDDGPDAQASGWLAGYGAVPADLARSLAADAIETGGLFRRLFTDPAGRLVAMESVQRLFPLLLALFLRRRDRFCRNPWCEAPIRHLDHVTAAEEGGPTSADNGQGLCEACNHAKQAPGWRVKARTDGDGTHVVETTTPTGHVYESRPPPMGRRRE